MEYVIILNWNNKKNKGAAEHRLLEGSYRYDSIWHKWLNEGGKMNKATQLNI